MENFNPRDIANITFSQLRNLCVPTQNNIVSIVERLKTF